MLWVARFALYLRLGVLDTLVPLMAPALAATTPFTVLLAYRAFRGLPPEQWEAARLEGAAALATWWRVGLPLTRADHDGDRGDRLRLPLGQLPRRAAVRPVARPPGRCRWASASSPALDSTQDCRSCWRARVLLAAPPLLLLGAGDRGRCSGRPTAGVACPVGWRRID